MTNTQDHITVLRVDASARKNGSISRDFTNRFIDTIADRVAFQLH